MFRCVITAILMLAVVSTPAAATDDADTNKEMLRRMSNKPINIQASRAEGNRQSIKYIGNVFVQQEDVKLFCDQMTADYSESDKKISKIIADGNVRIIKGDIEGKSRRMVFDNLTRTVRMTGDPVIYRGREQITGDEIMLYVDDDRFVISKPSLKLDPNRIKREAGVNEGSKQ